MVRNPAEVESEYELRPDHLPLDGEGHALWREVFGAARPLRVEVGVGNSPFLIEVSRRAPDFNYLGFEYSRKRVIKFLKKVHGAGVENIRILRTNAVGALPRLVRPGSVDHFYINHPDPWPKRRHARNRFVVPSNIAVLERLLAPGGGISLRTDVPLYAEQMMDVLSAASGLENRAGPGRFAETPLEPFETPFEGKFRREGKPIYYVEFQKRA
jgi:tRNA (guanine-N7-)-methyltransferase